jgi:membrane protein YdbS with pleckstrin-like domain
MQQQPFSNETLSISDLPKFETESLQPLQKKYFKVIAFNILVFTIFLFSGISIAYTMFIEEFTVMTGVVVIGFPMVLITIILFSARLGFRKKGYAFRTHDAIYKSGIIVESTTIIPFNRVQHVALHQGFISRKLGLATIELFTAGGSTSDLQIPGLLLADAQKIKELIAKKINPIPTETKEPIVEENNVQTETDEA